MEKFEWMKKYTKIYEEMVESWNPSPPKKECKHKFDLCYGEEICSFCNMKSMRPIFVNHGEKNFYSRYNFKDNYNVKSSKPKSLETLSKKELIEKAEELGYKNLRNKKKSELLELIREKPKKEKIVFRCEDEEKIFPSINSAAKEMRISSSQIFYKMGGSKIINGKEWKITKE